MTRRLSALLAVSTLVPALAMASPALAQETLPEPVRAMIETAIESGDPAKVAAVVDVAKATNPDAIAEIDAMNAVFLDARKAKEATEAAAKEEALRSAGMFESWSGEGELGGFRATGNTSDTGFTAAIRLERKGIDWSHKLRARADYQETGGRATRERYFAAYEPRYQIEKNLFGYGLVQYDRDTFQGFDARYAVSGGLGYQVFEGDPLSLSVKAGPAFRRTEFTAGGSEDRLAGLFGLDFDWKVTDRITFTQDTDMVAETGGEATVIFDSSNTNFNLVTGLQAKIGSKLSTRLSYAVEYDSDPPAGKDTTDTLSRVSLIYGF